MSSPYGSDELINADQILDDSDDGGWEDYTVEDANEEVDEDVAAGNCRYMEPGEEEEHMSAFERFNDEEMS